MRYHFMLPRMDGRNKRRRVVTSVAGDAGKSELSLSAGGNGNWCSAPSKQPDSSSEHEAQSPHGLQLHSQAYGQEQQRHVHTKTCS